MATLYRRFRSSSDGFAAVEFSLLVPVMIVIMAATAEFGVTFKVYNQVNRLATQYAIAWSDCIDSPPGTTTTCSAERANYVTTSAWANFAPQLDPSKIVLQMFQVRMNGTTPSVMIPSGATLSATQVAAAQAVLKDGQIGVVVTAQYTHKLQYYPNSMATILPASLMTPSYTVAQLKPY